MCHFCFPFGKLQSVKLSVWKQKYFSSLCRSLDSFCQGTSYVMSSFVLSTLSNITYSTLCYVNLFISQNDEKFLQLSFGLVWFK